MTGAVDVSSHLTALGQGNFLRLVNYHNTPLSHTARIRDELTRLLARFAPVSLTELDSLFDDDGHPGPFFMPVFYEGYRANAEVAAEICDELGITAWFAICTGFVQCPPEDQEIFARAHTIGLLDEDLVGGRLAMSWPEVAALSQRHVVFPHTASHAAITDVTTPAQLRREVTEPKQVMDAVTGQSAAAFAWLHGTPFGTNPWHDAALTDAGYRYLISNTMIQRIG